MSDNRSSSKASLFSNLDSEDPKKLENGIMDKLNTDTNLRSYFYMEYKKNFGDGQKNPIVYSKFGKQCYNSNERFDKENFNQLIRTCNLKKIMKHAEESVRNMKQKGNKYSEPIQFPRCQYYTP